MLKNSKRVLLLLTIVFVFNSVAFPQEGEKQYRIVDVNGVKFRELVPNSPEQAIRMEHTKYIIILEDLNQSGALAVLETLSSGSLDNLVDLEVLDGQKKEIKTLAKSYRRDLIALEPSGNEEIDQISAMKIRAKYGLKIQEVLLPKQLETLAKKIDNSKRLLSIAVFAFKDLSPQQRKRIIKESEILHSRIKKKVKEIEQLQEETRKTILEIYRENLSDEQQVEFERYVEVDRVLKAMNLIDMFHDSDMSAATDDKKD